MIQYSRHKRLCWGVKTLEVVVSVGTINTSNRPHCDGYFIAREKMMKTYVILLLSLWVGVVHANTDLTVSIENTRLACDGIGAKLSNMKKMAGINTAVTGVGTVAGGVALGTGIAKSNVDKKVEELDALLEEMGVIKIETADQLMGLMADIYEETGLEEGKYFAKALREERNILVKKSKTLGNIRTGTLAGATVADTAGAIIAANNKIDDDLQTKIDECKASVDQLQRTIMQAKLNGEDTTKAQQIVNACTEYNYVDLSPINNRAKGAMISSIVGATTGLAGTVTSAMANTDSTRNDNTDSGKQKEKNLNTASNVLAGTTTVASGVATVFNATQISAIKKAVNAAEKCEEALK